MLEKCKTCTHSGRDCFPYIASLPSHDLIAWCKIRKEAMHLSNGEISERSNVPKGTVDRILSASDMSDCRLSTILPIICVLSGCKENELSCEQRDDFVNQELLMRAHDLSKDLKHANSTLNKAESSIQAWKRAFLGIITLCVLQTAALISYLSIDMRDSESGFFKSGNISPVGVAVFICALCAIAFLILILVESIKRKEKK
jgi:hypothetical protein